MPMRQAPRPWWKRLLLWLAKALGVAVVLAVIAIMAAIDPNDDVGFQDAKIILVLAAVGIAIVVGLAVAAFAFLKRRMTTMKSEEQ